MCEERGWEAKMSPVPRTLSSSCGTCVMYKGEALPVSEIPDEVEQIVRVDEGGYTCLYLAEGI